MPQEIEFDKRELAYIKKRYENGSTIRELAGEYGLSIPTLRKALDRAGVAIRPRGGKRRAG